jgi:membrane fusion protein (multidrug efflux system)
MVVNFRTARRSETHTLTAVMAHIVARRECGRMTSDPGYRELQSKPPPDGLRTYAGNDDPSLDVTARAPGSRDTLDARRDEGGLPGLLPRWALLRRRSIRVAAVVAAAGWWWSQALHYESTDDAFIDTRKVQVASALNGIVIDVPVTDNQLVEPGAVLVRIDPRDDEAALAQAKAQVAQAVAAVANLDAQINAQNARVDQAREQVRQAQAAVDFAAAENDRAQRLLKAGTGTLQQAQEKETNLRQNAATLASAQASLTAAERQVAVLQTQCDGAAAQLDQARAAQTQAETNLSRTQVQAPVRGRAASILAAKGAYAVAGQALMMFVPQQTWITANFKETQLDRMRPNQPAEIRIDAYPGRGFAGHVDSIQPGSGAAFSLLPPQNATGNYVKVVQRVPVKIVFDTPPEVYVGPGMSVVPSVKVR